MKNLLFVFLAAMVVISLGWYGCSVTKENKMSDLTQTDPELAALWDNFINKEVIPHGSLDSQTRYLVLLGAHIAAQSPAEFKIVLNEALDNGVSPVAAKEVVYQAIPYVGMAKAYDFLQAANHVMLERGIKLPLPAQATVDNKNRFDKGLAVQKEIFGETIDTMRANAPAELKHIQDYLSANCFGDYYTRGGINLKTRELLTFALLASLGGADNQLKGHVQGNLNMGNDREVLMDTITQLLPYIGYPRSLNAIAAVNETSSQTK